MLDDTYFAITFQDQGIYLMHTNDMTLNAVLDTILLTGVHCNDLILDKNQRLWAATSDGLYKQSFSKAFFHKVTLPPDEVQYAGNQSIRGILAQNHHYYVNQFFRGVLVYDSNLILRNIVNLNNKNYGYVPDNIFRYSKNELLLSCFDGPLILNTINGTVKKLFRPGMPEWVGKNIINVCYADTHNNLWLVFGGSNAVLKIDPATGNWKSYANSDPTTNFTMSNVVCIDEDQDGNIWIGGKDCITRFNYDSQRFDLLLISGELNYFAIDHQNNLWKVKNGMLISWNINSGKELVFTQPGFFNYHHKYVRGFWDNRIWISAPGKLISFNIADNKFSVFRGLPGETEDNSEQPSPLYFDTAAKRIFLNGNKSFIWFNATDKFNKRKPASTYITGVERTGDSTLYSADSAITLSYNNSSFTIHYTGINFDDGENNKYAYRLYENKPGNFIEAGTQKSAVFTNLKPGHYKFQVKTISSDGREAYLDQLLHVDIKPPYYQTVWFYLICFAAAAMGFLIFYRYRIRQILKVQTIRNNLASDLHDDIGSTLSSIAIMNELAKSKSPGAISLLDSIGESTAVIQENMRDLVWAVNPNNDKFGNLVDRMNQFASTILESRSISFQITQGGKLIAERIPMDQRRKVYLFFKEAINNAAKYSGADKVEVSIHIYNSQLFIKISDNGRGFNVNTANTGNGLVNFKRRAAELGGEAIIHSIEKEGTSISLSFRIA